jgi:hypothetical protein
MWVGCWDRGGRLLSRIIRNRDGEMIIVVEESLEVLMSYTLQGWSHEQVSQSVSSTIPRSGRSEIRSARLLTHQLKI